MRPLVTRYGLIFLSLAIVSGLGAAQLSGSALALLAWMALGFVMVSVSYFTETPKLLGKRQNGTLAPLTVALCMPVMLLNHALWWLMRRTRAEDPHNEVAPDIHVGGLPRPEDLPEDTQTIVDLTFEFTAHPEIRRHLGYRSFPMLDDGFPDPAEVEQIVSSLVDRPGPMLIHCAAGHGRSATLAAAVAIARGHFESVDQAELEMKRARPRIHIQARQRARLNQWIDQRK